MKFFVSYSRSVQETVRAIIDALRDEGEEVWWDQDLRAGQDWWATILHNIEQCQVCLFFASEKAVQSPYCMEELRYALARNRLVLPYVMDDLGAYTLPPEIMKGRIQYEAYEGTPDHIRERIRVTCGSMKWDQYKDRYTARPPEPNTGSSDLVDRLDKAIALANEGYFDEAILGFKDVSNNDYDEYGLFCHEWIDKINRYRDIAKLADRPAMKQLAKPKWEKFVEQYGDEFDPLGVGARFAQNTVKRFTSQEYIERGIHHHEKKKYNDAIADYTEAIRLDPNHIAYTIRGLSYNDGKKEYDRAIADYTEALRLNPEYAMAYFGRGNSYNGKKEYDLAIKDYTEAIRLDPLYADVYNMRGRVYRRKEEYNLAIKDYTEAIHLDPNDADVYNRRGFIYKTIENYDLAIADYEAGLRLDPNHSVAAENLQIALEAKARSKPMAVTAEDYLERGKNRAAEEYDLKIADYGEAIHLNPRLTEAYLRRAGNYNAKEDYDNALADYDEALRLEPDNFIAFNGRGLIYASLMQYTQAIKDYTEAIQLAPQFADVYYNRGISYASTDAFDEAITDYSEAIRLDPQLANAYYNRGLSYHIKRDYQSAIADYDSALKLDPNHPYAAKNRQRAVEAKAR